MSVEPPIYPQDYLIYRGELCCRLKKLQEGCTVMQVRVDKETCTGCGLCVDSCPEVFVMEDDTAGVKNKNVTADLEPEVKEAVENCPVEAIILE